MVFEKIRKSVVIQNCNDSHPYSGVNIGGSGAQTRASEARICSFGAKIGGTGVKIGCSWAKIVTSRFRIGPLETKLGVLGPRFRPLEP